MEIFLFLFQFDNEVDSTSLSNFFLVLIMICQKNFAINQFQSKIIFHNFCSYLFYFKSNSSCLQLPIWNWNDIFFNFVFNFLAKSFTTISTFSFLFEHFFCGVSHSLHLYIKVKENWHLLIFLLLYFSFWYFFSLALTLWKKSKVLWMNLFETTLKHTKISLRLWEMFLIQIKMDFPSILVSSRKHIYEKLSCCRSSVQFFSLHFRLFSGSTVCSTK